MKTNKNTEAKKSGERYGRIALTVFFIFMALLLFSKRGDTHSQDDLDLSYLLIPLIVPLLAILIRQIIAILLKGSFVKTLGDTILFFSIGLSLFILLSRHPIPSDYHTIRYYIMLLAFMLIGYRLTLFFLKHHMVLQVFIRSLIIFLCGIIFRVALLSLAWGELIQLELGGELLRIPLADLIFWSFTLTSLTILASLLSVSKNYYLFLFGKILGLSLPFNYIFFFVVFLYFISVRSFLSDLFPSTFVVIEWILLVVICLLLAYPISKMFRSIVGKVDYAQWSKHKHKLEIDVGDELKEITTYIDDFVLNSDKKNLMIYIIREAHQQQLSMTQIKEIVDDYIDYNDEPTPRLFTVFKYMVQEKANQARRKEVLADMIEKFKKRGLKNED